MSIVYPYSFAPAGLTNPDNRFDNSSTGGGHVIGNTLAWSTHPDSNYAAIVKAAFDSWSAVSGSYFTLQPDGGQPIGRGSVPQIRLYYANYNDYSGVAYVPPHNFYYPNLIANNDPYKGDILIGRGFILPGTYVGTRLQGLICHESGHAAFAMGHNAIAPSIMQSSANIVPSTLDATNAVKYAGPKRTKAQELGVGGILGRIYSAYRAIKNADPDLDGLHYWSRELTWAQIKSVATYGTRWEQFTDDLVTQVASWSNATFATNMYVRILGRSPTPTEQADAVALLAGSVTRGNYLRTVIDSGEAATRRNGLWTGNKFWFN